DGGFVEDQHSFIFSYYNTLNKKLMFECNRSLEAIYCEPNSGPSFGYNDVFISNECNSNLDSCCHIGYSYYNTINSYNSDESKIFLTGSDNFRVTEIEVFTKKSEKLSQDKIEKLCEKTGKNSKEIIEIYDTYNAVAINGQIKLNLFVAFLIRKNQNIETEKELKEMKRILNFVFEYFDQDKSGYLDFFEFIQCYFIFEEKNRKKSQKAILEFLFDLADKDKSQSLEIEEINDLLKKFPTILNRNNFASHLRDK
ncbi:kelch 21, partial [Brachionus plicatilis]